MSRLIAIAMVAAMFAGGVHAAASYPERPVRFILPNAAGGSPDTFGRILLARVSELMGQQFVVDNRPGGGGIIASESVAKATPDGYTLLQCGISQTISPALKRKLPYDTGRDFARIVRFGAVPNVLIVHPTVPAATLAELVSYARQNPGKLRYASTGIGFTPHLTMEYFKSLAGIDLLHVPYKAIAQAATEILGGHQVQVQFTNLPTQLANIRAGKVRALAVTSAQRTQQLPEIPTVSESGYPGFEMTSWYGVCAPARTPKEVLAALEAGMVKALTAPDVRQRFHDQGVDPTPVAGAEFDAFYRQEIVRWSKIVQAVGIKPD